MLESPIGGIMTNKEQLLFQAARQILQDQCPKHQEYYFCKKYIGEDIG